MTHASPRSDSAFDAGCPGRNGREGSRGRVLGAPQNRDTETRTQRPGLPGAVRAGIEAANVKQERV